MTGYYANITGLTT